MRDIFNFLTQAIKDLKVGCLPRASILVDGNLLNNPIKTSVDYSLAKLMLTSPQANEVTNLFKVYKDRALDTETLGDIRAAYSMDVATLYFLQRMYQNDRNRQAQDLYQSNYNQLISNEIDLGFEILKNHFIVFVPGLAYKEDTTTGADFARQRQLLKRSGISNELIETDEWGLASDNANIIAVRLKILVKQHSHIILVSASKGGLETAITLGKVLKSHEISSIKAWVSVGGILRGSPIADSYLRAPKSWLGAFLLWAKGKRMDVVRDLSYERRKSDFKELNFPKSLKIIHLMAAPLATQISKEIKARYCLMKKLGPNDGLSPLPDQLTEDGIVISEIGLDHFFRDEHIDTKTVALAIVAVSI